VIEPDSNDDSNTSDQRQAAAPTTAHNARKSHANLGYVRPEKQTVEDQHLGAMLGATG
jgi:hypothetical protein